MKIYTEKAYRFTATYESFDGNGETWRNAFYEVWRHQLTYSFAYEIELRENRSGVFLSMLVKEDCKDKAEGLAELGYHFSIDEEPAGIVYGYELPDDVESVFVEE